MSRITTYFKKHKRKILFGLFLGAFVLYFGLGQDRYYLDQDIKNFRPIVIQFLMAAFGILAVVIFIFQCIKTKSVKQSAPVLLISLLYFSAILFFLKDAFLGVALFANRQITKGTIAKLYKADFMNGMDGSRDGFIIYDSSKGQMISDRKLMNQLFTAGLKKNAALVLPMKVGILGIPFQSTPFIDIE